MSNVIRASFSLDSTSISLLKLISEYDLRPMSAEVRYLIRVRATQILNDNEIGEESKTRLRELLVIIDETDSN